MVPFSHHHLQRHHSEVVIVIQPNTPALPFSGKYCHLMCLLPFDSANFYCLVDGDSHLDFDDHTYNQLNCNFKQTIQTIQNHHVLL